jgi:hypothetical protein
MQVEQVRSLRTKLGYLQTARLAPPAVVIEHEHALAVDLAVLVRLDELLLPDLDDASGGFSHLGPTLPLTDRKSPRRRITYSISRCAHSAEL